MAIGHVRLKLIGTFSGVDVVNTLWYRASDLTTPNDAAVADVVAHFEENIQADWLAMMPEGYLLAELETQIWSAAWSEIFPVPPRAEIGVGGDVTGSVAGPANCAIVKFSFVAGSQLQDKSTKLIKRSYLAFGPIVETALGDGGAFLTTAYASGVPAALIDALTLTLADNVGLGDLVPERVSTAAENGNRNSILVAGAQFRQLASYRRSRQL